MTSGQVMPVLFYTLGGVKMRSWEAKTGMGQKWLMVNVTNEAVLEDVKQCIAIRGGKKRITNAIDK
jgi:hypothetical protein